MPSEPKRKLAARVHEHSGLLTVGDSPSTHPFDHWAIVAGTAVDNTLALKRSWRKSRGST